MSTWWRLCLDGKKQNQRQQLHGVSGLSFPWICKWRTDTDTGCGPLSRRLSLSWLQKQQGFPSLIVFKMLYYFINTEYKEKPRGAAGKVHQENNSNSVDAYPDDSTYISIWFPLYLQSNRQLFITVFLPQHQHMKVHMWSEFFPIRRMRKEMLRIFIWSVTVLSLHRNQVQYPNCLLLYNGTGGSSLSGMSSSELRLFNRDFLLKKNLRYTWLWWKELGINVSSICCVFFITWPILLVNDHHLLQQMQQEQIAKADTVNRQPPIAI